MTKRIDWFAGNQDCLLGRSPSECVPVPAEKRFLIRSLAIVVREENK